jgi:hypothetical protein
MSEVKIRLRTDPRAPFVKTSAEKGVSLSELANKYQAELPYRILAAKVNRQIREFGKTIEESEDITFLDMRVNATNPMYQYFFATRRAVGCLTLTGKERF